MIWMAVGCRYRESALDVREKLAFSEAEIRQALALWRSRYPELEIVILSTCNRVEIYAAMEIFASPQWQSTFPTNAAEGVERLVELLAEFHGFSVEEISPYCFRKTGQEVIRHLFHVASSLDSMVVGEGQISGQVQHAYALAVECQSVGSLLHGAFQRAGKVAKNVASETAIYQYRTSVPSVAVSCFARQIFEHFETKKTLVIGAGQMAEETLRYLREEGVRKITILNRREENARRMAELFQGEVQPWENLENALIEADLVVSATGATEPIVTRSQLEKLQGKRDYRPMFILDLAVPRDFEAKIESLSNIYLYTVDDLEKVCATHRAAREKDIPKAESVIARELQTFIIDIRHHKSGRVIEQLRQQWQVPKQKELQRLFNKLPNLDDSQRREIEYAFERLLNKLLHLPLESLRDEAGVSPAGQRGLLEAVRKLFGLNQFN